MTLSALIRGKSASGTFATAIPAIFATQPEGEVATVAKATVAKIATVASPKEEKAAPQGATVAKIATVAVANPPETVPEGATVAKIATVAVANPQEALTASRWWRLHYPDREPVELASFPPATIADILERHPDAIAAEPFDLAKPEPTRACATCAHARRSGCCGEPVAAGLSDLPGVIRYSPDRGATCPAWLAKLDVALERRILAMAERWGYSSDDLVLALGAARSGPDGWRRLVDSDEKQQ